MDWQVQQAKARFSELLDRTLKEGAETVTRHGKAVAVLVSVEEYRRLRKRGKGLKELLAGAPLEGVKIARSRDTGRTVTLPVGTSRCCGSGFVIVEQITGWKPVLRSQFNLKTSATCA